jgi:23S rRNA pseudouridine2605 synthase
LSKLGYCSRSQARELILAGRVELNGSVHRDPERRVEPSRDRIAVDGAQVRAAQSVYLMLNKPRGLVTTASDERGRDTVYACLAGAELPWVSPVGRLDKASEGLLLLTNDTRWASRILDPDSHLDKVYHVRIDRPPDEASLERLRQGVRVEGEPQPLRAKHAKILRLGEKTGWLEVTLDEGRNRHIRRLLAALDIGVTRLVRVSIGPLVLGELPKGSYRHLTERERQALAGGRPLAGEAAKRSSGGDRDRRARRLPDR